MKLDYRQKADHSYLTSEEELWDINSLFALQDDAINKHLDDLAGNDWAQYKDINLLNKHSEDVVDEIKDFYAKAPPKINQKLFSDAVKGVLEKGSPKKRQISTMKIGFYIALVVEAAVMVVQQVFTGDFNPFIIVLAVLLGLGGFMQGLGIGRQLVANWLIGTGRVIKDEQAKGHSPGTIWMLIRISAVRGFGASNPIQFILVFFVTLLFGEAVSIFEALAVKYKDMREVLLADMLRCQQWHA